MQKADSVNTYGEPAAARPYGAVPAVRASKYNVSGEARQFMRAYGWVRALKIVVMILGLVVAWMYRWHRVTDTPLALFLVMSFILVVWVAYVAGAMLLTRKEYLAGAILGLLDGAGMLLLQGAVFLLLIMNDADAASNGTLLVSLLLEGLVVWMAVRAIRAHVRDQKADREAYSAGVGWDSRDIVLPRAQPSAPKVAKVARPIAIARLIGAAVTADGMASDARLKRAQQGALKLLGEKHAAMVHEELATAPSFDDPDTYIGPLVSVLRAVPDSKLNDNLLKVARYVVAEGGTVDPMAEEFLSALRAALG